MTEDGFEPHGEESSFDGTVTYSISHVSQGNFVAITSTVGENDNYDTVNVVQFKK
jgi:hypothetical protein